MTRVEVNAGGRHIVVDGDGEVAKLAETAMDLWEHVEVEPHKPGPAIGFASTERPHWSGPGQGAVL